MTISIMTIISMMEASLERTQAAMKTMERPGGIDITKVLGIMPPKPQDAAKPRPAFVQRNGTV